jgi:signal peptidase I
MEPTIREGQVLVVQAYGSARPQRGDIIVFHPPSMPEFPLPDSLCKRIIAIPGDTLAITNTGVVLNGKPLVEPYVAPQNVDYSAELADPQYSHLTLQTGQYYVLGDNRGDSIDSRFFGPISRSSIEGKVVSII